MAVACKKQLVAEVAQATNMSQAQVARVLDMAFDVIATSVFEGGRFRYPNFGVFSRRQRKARSIKNPITNGTKQLAGFTTIFFRASRTLKRTG